MSLLDIIRQRLIDTGVVETDWQAFIGFTPDDDDQIIGLQLTGGFAQDTHANENVLESFQVKIRAGQFAFSECESKWREMFDALQDANLSSSGISMIQALASGPLQWYDDKQRCCMSANFTVVRDRP